MCRNPFGKGIAEYGCGQCLPCRLNRRRVWTARLMLESCLHPAALFVTLTYAPEFLPADKCVRVEEIQKFMRRLRKEMYPKKVRYYAVGEYGDQSQRPHYHIMLYGDVSSEEVRKCWSFGRIDIGTVTRQSCAYVAQYTVKGMTKQKDNRLAGRTPEFARMSLRPGIGAGAAAQLATAFSQHVTPTDAPKVIRVDGRIMPLGRYLRRKIRLILGLTEKTPDHVVKEYLSSIAERVEMVGGFSKWKEKRGQDQLKAAKLEELRRAKKGAQLETI